MQFFAIAGLSTISMTELALILPPILQAESPIQAAAPADR